MTWLLRAIVFFSVLLVPTVSYASLWSTNESYSNIDTFNSGTYGGYQGIPVSGLTGTGGDLFYAQFYMGITDTTTEAGQFVLYNDQAGSGSPLDCVSANYTDLHAELGVPTNATTLGQGRVITVPMSGSQCTVGTNSGYSVRWVYNPSFDAKVIFGAINGGTDYWYAFYDSVPPSTPDSPDTEHTSFWSVVPYDESTPTTTVPSSVPLNALGWIQGWKADTKVTMEYISLYDLVNCPAVSPSLCAHTIYMPIENIFETDPPNFSFNVSSTTYEIGTAGTYQGTWKITQPSFSLFGIDFWTSTLTSTTTYFTIGAQTSFDVAYLATMNRSFGSTTATSTPSDCQIWKLSDCINYLFIPDPDGLAFVKFSQMKETLMRKPPFGYFAQISSALTNASTTTASTTPVGITVVASILSPLRTGLSLLLWFMLLLWIFHRIRKFEFQA